LNNVILICVAKFVKIKNTRKYLQENSKKYKIFLSQSNFMR